MLTPKKAFSVLSLALFFQIVLFPQASADEVSEQMKLLIPVDEAIPKDVQKRIDAKRRLRGLNAQDEVPQNIPDEVDWRWRDSEIQRQPGNTCTAFALTASMENLLSGQVKLSENHLWSLYRKYHPAPAIEAASKNYITFEEYWPIQNSKPYGGYQENASYYLTSSQYLEDNISSALVALASGSVVYLSFVMTKDTMKCHVRPSPNSPAVDGGHAVEVVGYHRSENRFIVKNSWGKDCGENGYFYLPFEYCQRNGMYCLMYAINSVGQKN
jgi:hypothetical protein